MPEDPWHRNLFPVFVDLGGDQLAAECGVEGAATAPIWLYQWEASGDSQPRALFPSIDAFIRDAVRRFETRQYFVDGDHRIFDRG